MEFIQALKAARRSERNVVIPDIKCRSPKEGDLMGRRTPAAVARALIAAGAPVLSVVTEEHHFGGSKALLREIAALGVPVLRKDFLKTRQEIRETKELGASAVLLMYACLDDETLAALYQEAKSIGLDVLVEAHTAGELQKAAALGAKLIGINNRDIGILEQDDGTVRLTEALARHKPEGCLLISESAIHTPADVRRAVKAGADAALVGTALLRAEEPGLLYQKMCRKVAVKLCGMQDETSLRLCRGADLLGFVGAYPEPVPWNLSPAEIRPLLARIPGGCKSCLVTGGSPEQVIQTAAALRPDYLQLHHRESLRQTEQIVSALAREGVPVIRSIPCPAALRRSQFGTESPEELCRAFADMGVAMLLVDSRTADHAAAAAAETPVAFFREIHARSRIPVMLAGGISPRNVTNILKQSGAEQIDILTGIEERPGIKSPRLIEELWTQMGVVLMNKKGRFGDHGGQYIPETLMNAVIELEKAYCHYKEDPAFNRELEELFNQYAGRPSRLYHAKRMTNDLGGAKIYLKREDLNHTGAHKINNVLGQALLAKKMGKTRLIAETGAGQHGVATATAAALMGMECVVFMGAEDMERQALNVYRMRLLGAEVVAVTTGTSTLKDAVSEAMREWTSRIADTHYCLGSVMGPHPFPTIVRDFQAVISREIREQMLQKEGRLPDAVLACVGGGSNAIGSFYHFIDDPQVQLIGCEAAGRGVDTFETAATLSTGRPGIFHGMKSYFCQDQYGQIAPVYSISAGLDYPGVGPEHAYLHDIGRASYVPVTDEEAVAAFEYLARTEGIIPAIESAHAVAHALKIAPAMEKDRIIVITISGRGDKDCAAIARYRGEDLHE